MFGFFSSIGNVVISNIIQMLLGYAVSLLLVKPAAHRLTDVPEKGPKNLIVIALASIAGTLLPLGPYGIIPLIALAAVSRIRLEYISSLFIANSLFNSLVPFTDNAFTWQFGLKRLAVALAAGFAAGLLVKLSKADGQKLLHLEFLETLSIKTLNYKNFIGILLAGINITGLYLVAGAAAEVLFHRYAFMDIMNVVYQSSTGGSAVNFLMNYDVTIDSFLLASTIVNTLMSLLKLSSLFFILRLRGLLGYLAYNAAWVVLLVLPVFLT